MEPDRLDKIIDLLFKQKTGKLSVSEQDELDKWKEESSSNKRLLQEIGDEVEFAKEIQLLRQFDSHKALTAFKTNVMTQKVAVVKSIWKYTAAAAVLLIGLAVGVRYIGVDSWFSIRKGQVAIVPGGNKASLVLENGQRIVLDENPDGIVFGDSIYYNDGQAITAVDPSQWLTIETPKGGEYKLTLADGTRVWLNSDTEFKYQRGQAGGERKVFLNGEAYFEVVAKRRILGDSNTHNYVPFRVVSGRQEVMVLGTSFNVMAYATDNRLETTLLEGKVSVYKRDTRSGDSKILRPGQQADWDQGVLRVRDVDVESYVAWKEGKFMFESQKLVNIMNMLSRWYDIEVVFDSPKEDLLFTGSMDRKASFKDILDKIGGTKQVSFRIEGRRVTVM